MKMLSPQNRFSNFRPDDKKKNRTLIVSVLVILLLIGLIAPLRRVFSGILDYAGKPLWVLRDRIATKFPETANYFASKNNLYQENNNLKNEITGLANIKIENESLKLENQELKNILSLDASNEKRLVAPILVRPKNSGFDVLIIGAGRSSGVSVGDYVYQKGHFVLGKIIEITNDTSKVQLFSYGDSKTDILLGKSRSLLQAVGEGGQNFSVQFPADIEINEGDVALLQDRQGSILAIVEKIISTEGGLIREAIMASPVNINELRYVEVILGNSVQTQPNS